MLQLQLKPFAGRFQDSLSRNCHFAKVIVSADQVIVLYLKRHAVVVNELLLGCVENENRVVFQSVDRVASFADWFRFVNVSGTDFDLSRLVGH